MTFEFSSSRREEVNERNVVRRKLLRLGTLATALSGISVLSNFGHAENNAHAAPSDKNPSTTYVPTTEKGAASGVATLDAGIKIPSNQIPDLSNTYIRLGITSLNVKAAPYNAKGDGITIDRIPIQNAINDAHREYAASGIRQAVVIPAGVFLVDAVNYIKDDGSVFGATSITLLDGVDLIGVGILKVRAGAYGMGAFFRAISSRESGLSNASIEGITIDGNSAGQPASKQCSNIVLEARANVTIENIKSINANGNAIMIRGDRGWSATNLRITDNTVLNASGIGIQSSQFDGLVIANNYVANTKDNCIDIYGENGTTQANASNFIISGNVVKDGLVGIFPETSRDGVVTGNSISRCMIGIAVNRINGEPKAIVISSNIICSCQTGISITGDTGGINIRGNYIRDFSGRGLQLGTTHGNISKVTIEGNDFHPLGSTTPLVAVAGKQAAWLRVRHNSTSGTDRAYDVVNTALSNVQNLFDPPFHDQKIDRDQAITVTDITVQSGGNFKITVPANTSGILTIKGTAGGAWQSLWVGAVVSGPSLVSISPLSTLFTAPGNAINDVAGSKSSAEITVSAAASGSTGVFAWTYRYM